MSAPRTNADIAEKLEAERDLGISFGTLDEAIAALREEPPAPEEGTSPDSSTVEQPILNRQTGSSAGRESPGRAFDSPSGANPPALPAEVEAVTDRHSVAGVIKRLTEHRQQWFAPGIPSLEAEAATLLRCYAKAVADLMDNNESLRVIVEETQSAYERTASENETHYAQAVAEKDARNDTVYAALMDKDAEIVRLTELLQEIDSHWRRRDYAGAASHHHNQVAAILREEH